MAQHPQQHTTGGTVTRTVTVTRDAPATPAPVPITLSPSARLAIQRHADLLASVRVIGPSQQAGIVSGPGNQGTACPANIQGHAGTSAAQVPRNLKIGGPGVKP